MDRVGDQEYQNHVDVTKISSWYNREKCDIDIVTPIITPYYKLEWEYR